MARRPYVEPPDRAAARAEMQRRGQSHGMAPIAGHYLARLVSAGPLCAVSLRFGPSLDPDTGVPLDRPWLWHATLNGEPVEVDRVWPYCASRPVDEAEYRYRLARRDHALAHDEMMPEAAPRERIDHHTIKPLF